MSETRDLLLEIGVEELPARMCSPALEQLKQKAEAAFAEARLAHRGCEVFGTPRRLVLLVHDLALRQADREVKVRGPARAAAFDAQGRPTRAAEGFARSQGVPVESLVVAPDDRGGEYVWAVKKEEGQSVATVLPPLLERLILSIEWPKSMRWGTQAVRYARPIRWIVALLGDRRVPLTVAGVESGRHTRGHRTLAPADVPPIENVHDYFAKLAHLYVMVDPVQRKNVIWHQVQKQAEALGGYVPRDEDLLEEVTWLVEQPYAFAGRFDPAFLEVPAEVLVTSMREHQRYFPVYDRPGGKLLPYFIAVRNGLDEGLENVIRGNEKVLRARLADARFFWDEDRKQRLEGRLPALRQVVFQEKLGSQYERVQRIERLAAYLAGALGLSAADRERAVRAAHLCKCDLVTHMVFEFPELQGVMGKHYALHDGEDPQVAEAIYEHYLPRAAGDDLPQTPAGIAVALADRLDTLAGYFGLGLIPTGSADPFALRRAAQGVVAIVTGRGLRLSLEALLDQALTGYPQFDHAARTRAREALLEFFRARVETQLRERGLRHDVVDAVLAAGFDDLADAVRRAEALSASLEDPEFAAVTGAFKRVANLALKNAAEAAPAVDPALLEPGAEFDLWDAFQAMRAEAEEALARGEYLDFYRISRRLKEPVDAFLDTVRVMVEDEAVRNNRLALLKAVAELLSRPADLAKLAVG